MPAQWLRRAQFPAARQTSQPPSTDLRPCLERSARKGAFLAENAPRNCLSQSVSHARVNGARRRTHSFQHCGLEVHSREQVVEVGRTLMTSVPTIPSYVGGSS